MEEEFLKSRPFFCLCSSRLRIIRGQTDFNKFITKDLLTVSVYGVCVYACPCTNVAGSHFPTSPGLPSSSPSPSSVSQHQQYQPEPWGQEMCAVVTRDPWTPAVAQPTSSFLPLLEGLQTASGWGLSHPQPHPCHPAPRSGFRLGSA